MTNIRDQVKVQAIKNIEKAQERQKKSQDAKQQPLRFKEGDTVLLRNLRNEARKGGKLERAWSGPYTISKVLPKGLYNLRNEDGTELKTSFDSSRLKIYYHSVQSHINTNTQIEDLLQQFQQFECCSLFVFNSYVYGTTRYKKFGRNETKWLFFFIFIEECCFFTEKNIDKKLPNTISYQI